MDRYKVITSGAPPSLARLPMTPEEVAASYEEQEGEAGNYAASGRSRSAVGVPDPD